MWPTPHSFKHLEGKHLEGSLSTVLVSAFLFVFVSVQSAGRDGARLAGICRIRSRACLNWRHRGQAARTAFNAV
jgi:hypothetical protein